MRGGWREGESGIQEGGREGVSKVVVEGKEIEERWRQSCYRKKMRGEEMEKRESQKEMR